MQESTHPISILKSNRWSVVWNTIAQSRLWIVLLTAIGSLSSVIYAHAPLVAFGAVAGTTLRPRRALGAAIAIWLANQLYGFGLRHYPQTAESLAWGLVMGLGTVLVTAIAALRPSFSQTTHRGHGIWVAIALLSGFLVFEGLVLSLGFLLTGSHVLTWAILARLLVKDVLWGLGLTVIHLGTAQFLIARDQAEPLC
ncbi:MAG: hypothetical protein IGR76_15630 [Synechococcales cyanobacterium T60_A2020_003]|nr:hypothetical protein [Synechococcales cyanobacterium T60_A2020_003]